MRHQIYIIPAMAALMVLGSCSKKKAAVEQTPSIEVAEATEDSVVTHRLFPGTVVADEKVDVVARVNGTIQKQCFRDGDYVRKGQVLFIIESTTYRNAVEEAKAQLAAAQSRHDFYSRQYEAMKKALASDAVSEMNVIESGNNMRQAEADINQARAALSDARTQLGYCTVTAPISGRTGTAGYDVGNFVSGAGAPVVLTSIVDNSRLKVSFEIDNVTFASLVPEGINSNAPLFRSVPLTFREPLVDTYTTDLFYNSPSVSGQTGTVTLEGTVRNDHNELKDGMYATVQLPLGVNAHATLVRDASIGTDQLGKYLYVVNDSDKVVYTPISAGELYHDSLRVVNKGIMPGQRYVTKALLTVRNGMTVKPVVTKQ